MAEDYIYMRELREQARVPEKGILSQTLQDGNGTKVVLFGFAPGQELSAHTAPYPAILTFLKGEASLKLGSEEQQAVEGTFVYMCQGRSESFPPRRSKRGPLRSCCPPLSSAFGGGWSGALRRP